MVLPLCIVLQCCGLWWLHRCIAVGGIVTGTRANIGSITRPSTANSPSARPGTSRPTARSSFIRSTTTDPLPRISIRFGTDTGLAIAIGTTSSE